MTDDPVALSADFLAAVRAGDFGDEPETDVPEADEPEADVTAADDPAAAALAAIEEDRLAAALDADAASLAFWCNVYNAAAQRALAADASLYDRRRRFFRTPLVTVAGRELSLNDVEHSILRRGYLRYALGYVRHPLWGGFPAAVAPDERDPRIHFALNCGASSCPAIRAYTRSAVDDRLDRATRGYLAETVEYDPAAGRVAVPRVFLWFRGDFGGKAGILAFLRRHDALPAGASPRLSHRRWDWSRSVGDFA